jgi:SAM-dependent methyltransferase
MATAERTGSAAVQGRLWGARANDWANVQEPAQSAYYDAVFDEIAMGPGARLLDVGCGSGVAAEIATERGARVTGLDTAEELVAIARDRVAAGTFDVGDLEDLPYADDTFDAVTSFNAVQYAAYPPLAVREAKRVAKRGAPIVILTWGRADRCEAAAYLAALGSLLPPAPPNAPGPFALSEPSALEELALEAGATPGASSDVETRWEYANLTTALRGLLAAGPAVRAIEHAGEPSVIRAVTDVLEPFVSADGSVRLENEFRYLIATA